MIPVILALAVLALPAFVPVKASELQATAISSAGCCCSAEKAHTGGHACRCSGCAEKESRHCGCVQNAPPLSALLPESFAEFHPEISGHLSVIALLYAGRTDAPLLRPPIFS